MPKTLHRLLIAGLPRCGTTLLASLLNQQPGCRFVTDYSNWFRDAQERLGVGWNDRLTAAQRRVCLALAREDWIRLRHPVLVRSFTTINELHAKICEELAQDAVVVGHKTLLTPDQIVATARDTRIGVIVMVRDPRAAALSYWYRTGSGVESYVRTWNETVTACLAAGKPDLLMLRFEDLIEHPLRTLQRISERWDTGAELPNSLSFQRGSGGSVGWNDNSAYHDVETPFDSTAVDRWHSQRSSPVVRYADVMCRRHMSGLGYRPLPLPGLDVLKMRLRGWVMAVDRELERGLSKGREALVRKITPPLVPESTPERDQENS